jgi:ABC-type transport system involved in multi-copper enzyme maturation permease subunit
VFIAGVLFALAMIWWAWVGSVKAPSIRAQAAASRDFWAAITVTQLAVVLLAAPAATAGAICLDRARGTLEHVLVTDLRSWEIVVGKLAARVLPVLGILVCLLPILAIESLLGGVDAPIVVGAMLVTLGVAISGCSAALALSTWGTKVHEVLLATYAAWALWLVAVPIWSGYRLVVGPGMPPPSWFLKANPIWLVSAWYLWPSAVRMEDFVAYLGGSVLVGAAFTAIAIIQLRRVAARQAGHPRSGSNVFGRFRPLGRLFRLLPGPSLDANPVLWREWHRRRPSRWAGAVWSLYAAMAIGLTATMIALSVRGSQVPREVASIGNGFQAGIGLLLLSISAATALAEERVRGSLDILLATTLSTRSIVWGKWCGAYRAVPKVAICPGLLAAALALESGRWDGAFLVIALFLAYGAAVTSLGLALATWIRRVDFAVCLNVAVLGGVTVGWLFVVALTTRGDGMPGIGAGSPIIGITLPTAVMSSFNPDQWAELRAWWIFWIALYALVASGLAWAVFITFDGCLGRMSDRPRARPAKRVARHQ